MKGILLTFKSLPCRVLGCYGSAQHATPHFNRLAAQSVVFDQCLIDELLPTVDELESDAIPLFPETMDVILSATRSTLATHHLSVPIDETELSDSIRRLDQSDEGGLMWLNTKQPTVVAEADATVGIVLNALDPASDSDWLLVVTALEGDDGRMANALEDPPWSGTILPSAQVQVPCLIRWGNVDQRRAGRNPSLIQLSDVWATLLDWFGLPMPNADAQAQATGTSLRPLIERTARQVRTEAIVEGGDIGRGLRNESFYFMSPTDALAADDPLSGQLFAKPEDAWDVFDISRQSPDVTEQMHVRLRELVRLA